jgi:hypothetical protein
MIKGENYVTQIGWNDSSITTNFEDRTPIYKPNRALGRDTIRILSTCWKFSWYGWYARPAGGFGSAPVNENSQRVISEAKIDVKSRNRCAAIVYVIDSNEPEIKDKVAIWYFAPTTYNLLRLRNEEDNILENSLIIENAATSKDEAKKQAVNIYFPRKNLPVTRDIDEDVKKAIDDFQNYLNSSYDDCKRMLLGNDFVVSVSSEEEVGNSLQDQLDNFAKTAFGEDNKPAWGR